MPLIPAICDKCGRVVRSQIKIKDTTMHIKDHQEETCSCGGAIRILDGTYTHLGGPINYCNAPKESLEKFKEMLQCLQG